tara:strand:+ start:115 stop:570 length:456 start_codon:yes stop_codon:yes gene_type:complete
MLFKEIDMRLLIATLFLFFVFCLEVSADTRLCVNNILKHDICAEAKRIAAEEQKTLPYKMTDRVQIISFTANLNILTQGIKLLYDRAFLENALVQQGRSLDSMKRQMFENSTQIACGAEISKAFLDMGGHMRFVYEFANGEIVFEFYVSAC